MVRLLPWLEPDKDKAGFEELLKSIPKPCKCIASSHVAEGKEQRERSLSFGLSGVRIPSPPIHLCGSSTETPSYSSLLTLPASPYPLNIFQFPIAKRQRQKTHAQGLPWQSSGYNKELLLQGLGVRGSSLVGELRSRMPCSTAQTNTQTNKQKNNSRPVVTSPCLPTNSPAAVGHIYYPCCSSALTPLTSNPLWLGFCSHVPTETGVTRVNNFLIVEINRHIPGLVC